MRRKRNKSMTKNTSHIDNPRTAYVLPLHDSNEALSIDCKGNSFIFRWKPCYALWLHIGNPVLVSPKPLINSSWVRPNYPRSLLHWWNLQLRDFAGFLGELVPPPPSQMRTETGEPLQKDAWRFYQAYLWMCKSLNAESIMKVDLKFESIWHYQINCFCRLFVIRIALSKSRLRCDFNHSRF